MPDKDIHEELPSNSLTNNIAPVREGKVKKSPVDPTQKPKAVVKKGNVKRLKKPAGSVLGESVKQAGSYVFVEVLIPAAKSMLQDMMTKGLEMILYGESQPKKRSRRDDEDGRTFISYGSFHRSSRRDREESPRGPRVSRKERIDLDDIFFRYGPEANEILEKLQDALDHYDQVTVADFYELANIEDESWVNHKFGWDDLSDAYCTHTRNGYQIVFPQPIELD